MNGPVNSAGTGSFSSCLKAISDMEKLVVALRISCKILNFQILLNSRMPFRNRLSVEGLLPQQDFSQIEALLTDGNGLPPAAVPSSEFDPDAR